MISSPIPSDKSLFGQYLLENHIITNYQLYKALKIQEKENSSILKDSHRLLGQILLEQFNVFKNRIELNKHLEKFKIFKSNIEFMRNDAKTYGKK